MPPLLLAGLVSVAAAATPAPVPGDCAGADPAQPSRCIYRSAFPSTGLVAHCQSDRDCRVGYYYGDPGTPTWLDPPPGLTTLPKPEVIWHAATFAEVRFDCGAPCRVSYFFEAKRRRVSPPRAQVLDVDIRRLLVAQADARTLVVRQIFSGREVARLDRDWSPGSSLEASLTAIHFDPDGRLTFTWLKGQDRAPVTERVSVPSIPRRP